ncbi:hypothetical protein L7F22_063753 [Adiantum nelumboides]|nr:hypothetical protein [Adiantum nelumboides]
MKITETAADGRILTGPTVDELEGLESEDDCFAWVPARQSPCVAQGRQGNERCCVAREIKFFTLEVVETIEVEEEIMVVEAMPEEVNGKTNKIKVTMIIAIEAGVELNLVDVELEDLYILKENVARG